jgi:ABC-type lipoprotein release transport system permease subunit
MGAVRLLAGSEIRRRWRSTLAITLLVGIVGAIFLATAAGARRSESALDRFNAVSLSSDIEISVGQPTPKQIATFAKTPGVAAVGQLRAYAFALPEKLMELSIAMPLDSVFNRDADRSRIIAGRQVDPNAPDEMTIGESLADQFDLEVGDTLKAPTFTQEQIKVAFSGGPPGAPAGPVIALRVVGIVRRPLDLGVRSAGGGVAILSPAFRTRYADQVGAYTDVLRVRTERGTADVPGVTAVARKMFGQELTFGTTGLGSETEGARSAIDVITLALAIVAAVTAISGLVAIGIVMTRDISRSAVEQPVLRGLGLTRGQRILVSVPRALIMAGAGTLLAVAGAVALSPLFPIGVARLAEPDPGLHVDWTVLGVAGMLLFLVVLGIASLAASRSARRSSVERDNHEYRRTSTILEQAAGAGLRPTATNGLRMAIQSGRGEARVPVRSAFLGAVFGIAGVTAALVFAASLGHLMNTPRLYGWTWDVHVDVDAPKGPCADRVDHGINENTGAEAVGHVCITEMQVAGRPASVWGFQSLHGTIAPEIVEGRAPQAPNEVALGSVTLDAAHKAIGDTVKIRGRDAPRDYVIVGRMVLPSFSTPQPLADGAALTGAGWTPLYEAGGNETNFLVVRTQPGGMASVRRLINDIERRKSPGTPTRPVEVTRLEQINRIPASIAALLGAIALIAVAYALVTAVRRRRHELAILKILGFDRRQVRATVAWHATILGAVGLVLGLPIGIVIGRFAWQLVADGLGTSTDVTVPALWLVLAVPATLLLVNLIAFFPARSAANTRPAVSLRTE